MDPIKTLQDLEQALKNGEKDRIDYWRRQVTVQADVEKYFYWLSSTETSTSVVTNLRRTKTRSSGIHPSSACKTGVCHLALYFGCTGEVEPKRSYCQESQLTWDIGTLLHDTWQMHFKNMYQDQFRYEVPLQDNTLLVKSSTDGIFTFSHLKFILEMKSIKEGGNFGWETIQKKPMDDNVRQAHFYMKLADVPFALILYLNKNRGIFKEHAVAFDFSIWENIVDSVLNPVIEAVRSKSPPEGSPGFGCRYCDYEHGCPALKKNKAEKEKAHAETISRTWSRRIGRSS
jgi:hypothetical protein